MWASVVVARMMAGARPQPPQTSKPADSLALVQKQQRIPDGIPLQRERVRAIQTAILKMNEATFPSRRRFLCSFAASALGAALSGEAHAQAPGKRTTVRDRRWIAEHGDEPLKEDLTSQPGPPAVCCPGPR